MRTAVRLVVAIAIIAPLLLLFGGGWLTTFSIALIGFGSGRTAEWLLFGAPRADLPADATRAQGLWIGVGGLLLGLGLFAAVQLIEYRLHQTRDAAVAELQQTKHRQEQAAAQAQTWQVRVLSDGSVMSNGNSVSLDALIAPPGATEAVLRADSGASHAQIVAVMDQIRAAGISEIAVNE